VYPIRFDGTWKRYSNSAIPQLRKAATYHFLLFQFRKCEYQANVMNALEKMSRTAVAKMRAFTG
jgi:hypothetical protein